VGPTPDAGILYLVATPLGNMEDLSPRAVRILAGADAILAEDTRRSGRLGPRRGPMISYNDHNAAERLPMLRRRLESGERVALVTDAGTPGISDPCFRAVRTAIECGARVEPIPGPCAATAALVASGLPTDRFFFEGFPPMRKGPRMKRLSEAAGLPHRRGFYTGPLLLARLLGELAEVMGDRRACIAREISKVHEEFVRGTLSSLLAGLGGAVPRGEVTLVVEGRPEPEGNAVD